MICEKSGVCVEWGSMCSVSKVATWLTLVIGAIRLVC